MSEIPEETSFPTPIAVGSPTPGPRPTPLPLPRRRSMFLAAGSLVLSAVGFCILLGASALLGISGLTSQFDSASSQDQTLPQLSLAWGVALIAVLMLPAAVLAILDIFGKPTPAWIEKSSPAADRFLRWGLPVIWVLLLGLGSLAANLPQGNWLVFPPLNTLAVALPILWLVWVGGVGTLGHSGGPSPRRTWGALIFSLTISNILMIMLEVIAVFLFTVLVAGILSTDPNSSFEMQRLAQRLLSTQTNPEVIIRILRPYFSRPGFLYSGFVLAAVLIPLIEELIKPLALWLLAGRGASPREGFALGLICGAGMALAESLAYSSLGSLGSSLWVTLMIGRSGTGLVHVLCTGLMGWAMASAWGAAGRKDGKIIRLGLIYLLVVFLHGLWNTFSLLSLATSLISSPLPAWLTNEYLSIASLGILSAVLFLFLIYFNSRLKNEGN